MSGICAVCGSSGPVHAHHATGRPSPRAPYLEAALTLDVCARCHLGAGGIHQTLRTLGLEFPPAGAVELGHRLRRVAVHARLVGSAGRSLVLAPSATAALGRLLIDAADAVGARP